MQRSSEHRSYLSALAAAGVGIKELQELARHSDPRLTLGIYTHAREESLSGAVARLQLPGMTEENPLARLSRAELEAGLVVLAVIVRSLTGLVAPGVAPAMGISGGASRRVGTEERNESRNVSA